MLDKLDQIVRPEETKKEEILPKFPNEYEMKNDIMRGLRNIESMEDKSAYEFVEKNVHNLFETKEYKFAFQHVKFLTALQQVCHEVQLDRSELITCNSILYELLSTATLTDYKKKLMYILAETLNRYTVNQLLGKGVEPSTATYAGLCNTTSQDMTLNIRRVNFALTTFNAPSPKFYTVQKFVDIYGALYHNVLSNLLSATVFDTEIKKAIDADEYWVTKDMIEVDENIGWAVLFILESIPAQNITQYLMSISEQFGMEFGFDTRYTKFSFHNLPINLFRKIPVLVEQLEGFDEPVVLP